jgi:hypothetical protein
MRHPPDRPTPPTSPCRASTAFAHALRPRFDAIRSIPSCVALWTGASRVRTAQAEPIEARRSVIVITRIRRGAEGTTERPVAVGGRALRRITGHLERPAAAKPPTSRSAWPRRGIASRSRHRPSTGGFARPRAALRSWPARSPAQRGTSIQAGRVWERPHPRSSRRASATARSWL